MPNKVSVQERKSSAGVVAQRKSQRMSQDAQRKSQDVQPKPPEDALALDVVAPGEEDLESRSHHTFEKSTMMMKSVQSNIHREKWGSKTQFLMSLIASAVGLGNVWRFPAICARNGGAAFLIPYLVVLTFIARPLFILELSMGQFSSKGSVRCWDMSPIFTGLGFTGAISSVLLSSFYMMLLAWALIYTVLSFVSLCSGDVVWGSDPGRYFGEEVLHGIAFNDRLIELKSWVPVAHLVLAYIFSWMIVWGTMVFGVEASGKIAYVTALAPYVVLVILLIVGLTLPGMSLGLQFFIIPDWSLILDPNTWFQAVGQCFFSLGIGFGGLIMFSSYNEFQNDLLKDVLVISVVDTVTSILAGLSLMSILGYTATAQYEDWLNNPETPLSLFEIANRTNCLNEKFTEDNLKLCTLKHLVNEGGAGVAFVQYPAAMYKVNKDHKHVGGLLGFLFFLMLILLAVGSANGFVGTSVTILSDMRPKWKRTSIVSGVCIVSFLIGIIYTNGVGSEWFDVVDQHGVTSVLYILAFLEVIAVIYVYGLGNFAGDMEYMRGGRPLGWYMILSWLVLPFLMLIIFIAYISNYAPGKTWTLPVKVIAWIITSCCLLIIPGTALYKYFEFKKNPWKRNVPNTPCAILAAITRPAPRWGPKDPEIRAGWKIYKAEVDPSTWLFIKRRVKDIKHSIIRCCYRLMCKTPPIFPPTRVVSRVEAVAENPLSTAASVATPESHESKASQLKSSP